jgi:hypothetical protein
MSSKKLFVGNKYFYIIQNIIINKSKDFRDSRITRVLTKEELFS